MVQARPRIWAARAMWGGLCAAFVALACHPGGPVEPSGDGPASAGPRAEGEAASSASEGERPRFDDPVIDALLELAREDSQVDARLAEIVGVGPRLTGSTQCVEAEKLALARLRSWGLEAEREQWGELPVLFERGRATGDVIRPVRATIDAWTPAWSPGTRGQDGVGAGGPTRGQALLYPRTAAEFRVVEPYLRDAWIMIPHGFELPGGRLELQIERAFELARISGYVRASGPPGDDRISTYGDPLLDPAELPERVEILMRGDEHQVLLDRMAVGDYVELGFAVGNLLLPGPVPAFNVIARLPGGELPEQQVIVGAHLDSWDGGVGALDNATGVATTLEAARLLAAACARAGVKPRRSVAFHLWTGEEQGRLGSRAWVEAHAEQRGQISAVLVHDGGTNYLSSVAVVPELHARMSEAVAPARALAPAERPFALELVEALPRERGPRSEAPSSASFLDAGIPAFAWGQSGRSDDDRYRDTQHDRPEAVIDVYQRHSALIVAMTAWQLASQPELLPRENLLPLPPSEERDARIQQRRARFGPELLPWDDPGDGEVENSSDE